MFQQREPKDDSDIRQFDPLQYLQHIQKQIRRNSVTLLEFGLELKGLTGT